MNALEQCDAIEAALIARISLIYGEALRTAIKRRAAFLKKVKAVDEGKIKPPQYYVDTDQVDKWREGFVRELIRQENVIDGIMDELDKAGVKAADLIRDTMPDYYAINRDEAVRRIADSMRRSGLDGRFSEMTRRQIKVLLTDQEGPFTRLAYLNMGRNAAVRTRLQNELAVATILGESQQQIIRRIRAVTGQSVSQARRVAQTERTRVQSQARWDAGAEAMAMGVKVVNEWSTRMVNSRDSHVALNGKKALQGECFPGSPLRFPGDPSAPAREVVNCHCVIVPDVLRDGQKVVDGRVI
jgi:hypothetical protein